MRRVLFCTHCKVAWSMPGEASHGGGPLASGTDACGPPPDDGGQHRGAKRGRGPSARAPRAFSATWGLARGPLFRKFAAKRPSAAPRAEALGRARTRFGTFAAGFCIAFPPCPFSFRAFFCAFPVCCTAPRWSPHPKKRRWFLFRFHLI